MNAKKTFSNRVIIVLLEVYKKYDTIKA